MQQLRFVGVHDDGEHLLFESNDGEQQFRAYIDSSLRSAVVKARRVNPARSLSGDGVFGPRDIQTRFRQGATVEEIVEESGWKPERVRRYEWPILAERSHVVSAARTVPVDSLDPRVTHRRTLNDQVVAVREHWHCAESEAQWNSWQREDGLWNVTISIQYSREALNQLPPHCDFPGRFVYNPANQTVTAANAVGEFLLGKLSDPSQGEAPVEEPARQLDVPVERPASAGTAPASSAHPSATDQSTADQPTAGQSVAQAAPGGTQAQSPEPSQDEAASQQEEPAAPREQPGSAQDEPAESEDSASGRPRLSAVPEQRSTPTEQLLDELEQARGTAPSQASAERVADLTQRLRGAGSASAQAAGVAAPKSSEDAEAPASSSTEQDDDTPASTASAAGEEQEQTGRSESSRSKNRRPPVPSWDDIVFGQHRRN